LNLAIEAFFEEKEIFWDNLSRLITGKETGKSESMDSEEGFNALWEAQQGIYN
jgi:hypothetical protein